jgi:Holliday junction DNA helicase RuvA
MIGSLRGQLVHRQAPLVIIECSGVGYEVETPMSTFLELPVVGEQVFLQTHLVVRESDQSLYGFATGEEKQLFRTLLRISGVGAKMALGILSGMSVRNFERCVKLEDSATLVKIPGVGKKTAERLIVEMRDKIDDVPGNVTAMPGVDVEVDARSEAMDALVALGYKPAEINKLLAKIDISDKSAEDIIRLALRQAVG